MMSTLAQLTEVGEWLMVVAIILMTATFLVVLRKRLKRQRHEPQLNAHEKLERIKQTHGMKDDMRTMMVELEELTRRFSAQLDAKSVRLEKLIEEADRRITVLTGDVTPKDELAGGRMIGTAAKQSNAPAPDVKTSDQTKPKRKPAKKKAEEPAEEPLDPAVARIYELADAGRSPLEIAGALNEQVGKVELILALRRA